MTPQSSAHECAARARSNGGGGPGEHAQHAHAHTDETRRHAHNVGRRRFRRGSFPGRPVAFADGRARNRLCVCVCVCVCDVCVRRVMIGAATRGGGGGRRRELQRCVLCGDTHGKQTATRAGGRRQARGRLRRMRALLFASSAQQRRGRGGRAVSVGQLRRRTDAARGGVFRVRVCDHAPVTWGQCGRAVHMDDVTRGIQSTDEKRRRCATTRASSRAPDPSQSTAHDCCAVVVVVVVVAVAVAASIASSSASFVLGS
jgi:hypothetical protein